MSKITINTARTIGKRTKSKGIVVLQLNDDDTLLWSSYGRGKAECQALKHWSKEFFACLQDGRLPSPWED